MDEIVRKKSTNEKCANCGSNLVFDPETQALKCASCQSTFGFEKSQNVKKHAWEMRTKVGDYDKWITEKKFVKCSSCGAQVMLDKLDLTQTCPYCGCDYVLEKEQIAGYQPDAVLPFMLDYEKIKEAYIKGVRKKFFAPRAFKKMPPVDKIRGIYVPLFIFDADSDTNYRGTLTKVVTKTNSKGKTVTERKSFNISGNKKMNHRDFIEESSSKINRNDLLNLLPYDLSQSFTFDEDFLRGYSVEHYDDDLENAYTRSHQYMETDIKNVILSGYDYTYVDSFNMKVNFFNELYTYRLAPVYVFEFTFKKKFRRILVNGQNGKIATGVPVSGLKVAAVSILGIIILIALIILFIYFD